MRRKCLLKVTVTQPPVFLSYFMKIFWTTVDEVIFILGGTLVSTEQVCSSDGVGW